MTQNQQQQPPLSAGNASTSKAGAGAGGSTAWEEANAKKRAREDQQAALSSSSAGGHKRVQVKKESSTGDLEVNQSVKQEDVSRGSGAHREATPMPVPISQASSTVGPSTTSQQQAAPGQPQQRSIHAVPQVPLGQASSSHRHLPSPGIPPPLSAYFHAPQQASYPPQTSYTHHGPSAIPPPRFPDPWYSSAAYHSARQSLNLVNDISVQVAVLLDEARWYEKSFSTLAPYPSWLSDRHAEVQDIVWRYQGSWRRFEKHVAAAARLALLELERAAGLEQGGG